MSITLCVFFLKKVKKIKKTSFTCVQYRHLGIELQIKYHKHFPRKSIKRKRKKEKSAPLFM